MQLIAVSVLEFFLLELFKFFRCTERGSLIVDNWILKEFQEKIEGIFFFFLNCLTQFPQFLKRIDKNSFAIEMYKKKITEVIESRKNLGKRLKNEKKLNFIFFTATFEDSND